MKLYMVPLAPNPTKVMLYIAERAQLGTEMGIEQITVNTVKRENRAPEHLARNPFGTLPVLEGARQKKPRCRGNSSIVVCGGRPSMIITVSWGVVNVQPSGG